MSPLIMKAFIVVLCVSTALVSGEKNPTVAGAAPTGHSTSLPVVSNEVLNKALSDGRFVMRQLKCANGEGPCDTMGRRLKALAPQVLSGTCTECSPTEISQIQRVLSHIQTHYPKEYAKMVKQYQG